MLDFLHVYSLPWGKPWRAHMQKIRSTSPVFSLHTRRLKTGTTLFLLQSTGICRPRARPMREEVSRRSHEELRTHADEPARFPRIAVECGPRMIELKQDVNAVRRAADLSPAL